jgi:hypothetical protein
MADEARGLENRPPLWGPPHRLRVLGRLFDPAGTQQQGLRQVSLSNPEELNQDVDSDRHVARGHKEQEPEDSGLECPFLVATHR